MTLPISILQGKRCKQESRGRKARAGWKVKAGPSRCRRVHPAVSLSISSVLSSRCDPTPFEWASQDVHNSTEGHTHSLAGRRCCQWRWRAVEQIPKWRPRIAERHLNDKRPLNERRAVWVLLLEIIWIRTVRQPASLQWWATEGDSSG